MAGFQISSDRTFPASFSAFVLEGELDIAAALPMLDALGEALARGGPITLDLSELTFIDSVGARAIVIAVERASGDVILHGVRGVVRTASSS
jgi:anti-anti-sigma factor